MGKHEYSNLYNDGTDFLLKELHEWQYNTANPIIQRKIQDILNGWDSFRWRKESDPMVMP